MLTWKKLIRFAVIYLLPKTILSTDMMKSEIWPSLLYSFIHLFIFGCGGLCNGHCLVMVHRLLTEVLSRCRASALGCSGFRSCNAQAAEHGLKSCPAAPWPVGSSQVREWTRVSWTGRRIPHHWAARGALAFFLKEFHHICRENSLCQGARFWKSTKFFFS